MKVTRAQQVLRELRLAQGGWVDGTDLANERVGGSEGLKRLRELRAEGWPIEERRHPNPNRSIWQYRLAVGARGPSESPAAFAPMKEAPLPTEPLRGNTSSPSPAGPPCPDCRKPMTVSKGLLPGWVEARCLTHGKKTVPYVS